MKGFEIIDEGASPDSIVEATPEISVPGKVPDGNVTLGTAVANNFGTILNLAGSVIEIQKMKTVSKAALAKMAEDRKTLLAETEAYVMKMRADTSATVDKMNVIRGMMRDFYSQSSGAISGDDFCKVITGLVNQMGRMENGIK